jgi:hypothetical protein
MNSITLEGLVGSGELWLNISSIICNPSTGQSMCDLGCHHAPYTPLLGYSQYVYVDIQYRGLDYRGMEEWFVNMDAIEYLKKCYRHFDLCIASDFLEHLTEEKGDEFLSLMQDHSDKQVIFTPLGDASITADGHPDSHASGWFPEDFPEWLTIVLPNFHPSINLGAFFAVNCSVEEKQRIYNEIKSKYVESGIN